MELTSLGKLLCNLLCVLPKILFPIYRTIEIALLSALVIPTWVIGSLFFKITMDDFYCLCDNILTYEVLCTHDNEVRVVTSLISLVLIVIFPMCSL